MADKVNDMTEELAKDYVGFKLGKKESASSLSGKILRRLAADLDRQHGDLFENMLRTVNVPANCGTDKIFITIATEMFADKYINWGRIAVLYTFAGHMAVYCERSNMKTEAGNVASWLSTFVNKNLSNWISSAGGWDAFNEYFKDKNDDTNMLWGNVLCTVGLVAGAAGAALVFAR